MFYSITFKNTVVEKLRTIVKILTWQAYNYDFYCLMILMLCLAIPPLNHSTEERILGDFYLTIILIQARQY